MWWWCGFCKGGYFIDVCSKVVGSAIFRCMLCYCGTVIGGVVLVVVKMVWYLW